MPTMTLTLYVVTALFAIVAFVVVGYVINSGMATASMSTQQQSLSSSQSSSASESVIITESDGSESVSSSSRIVTSTGNTDLQIDRQSSGKIASSRLNLTDGEVEAVLFGDWSLNNTSGFVTDFVYKPSNGTGSIEYMMSGFGANSVSRVNDNLVLAGTIDVVSNSTSVLQDAPVTIMIQNSILIIGFGDTTEAANLFGGVPIIGFEQ